MLKIRRPLGRLIFNTGIAIPGKTVFLIETAPWKSASSMVFFISPRLHVMRLQIPASKCTTFSRLIRFTLHKLVKCPTLTTLSIRSCSPNITRSAKTDSVSWVNRYSTHWLLRYESNLNNIFVKLKVTRPQCVEYIFSASPAYFAYFVFPFLYSSCAMRTNSLR